MSRKLKRKSKRKFTKGERYRPIVTIDKVRKHIPTVILVSGRRYVYDPKQLDDMHDIDHDEFTHKIIQINKVELIDSRIHATITTSFLGRITTKPYSFTLDEWAQVVESKRIE